MVRGKLQQLLPAVSRSHSTAVRSRLTPEEVIPDTVRVPNEVHCPTCISAG